MKVVFIILGILALALFALPIVLLFTQPVQTWLIGLRDVALIYGSLFMCLGGLAIFAMAGAIAFLTFTLRDHVVPALQKVDDTAKTVRGTATFVSESVVAPIIKTAGAAAGARAMVQTLMRRKPPKSGDKKNGGS
ncbi:MAG TPA: hypothetical protein VEX13_05650 [Chloroflexia bacterium]|nr:hypothetical protein [Chloroflexia bacterium]